MTALLSIQNLQVAFRMGGGQRAQAVGRDGAGISFDVPENTTVALVGESGSGKSVTAMSVLNLLPDNAERSGHVLWQGRDLLQASLADMQALRGKEIACVFQDPMSSLNPVFSVGQQLVEPLVKHLGLAKAKAWARAEELLSEVGIPEPRRRLDSYPHEMSGGQQQRVMIAMALACEPRLLIADEPTTALDVTIQRQIIELLARLKTERRMSVLFISHDLGLVGEIADQVVVMRHGQVREQGPVAGIFASPKDDYTKALLACRPSLEGNPRRLMVIDDHIAGRSDSGAAKAKDPDAPVVLEVRGLKKSFSISTAWALPRWMKWTLGGWFSLTVLGLIRAAFVLSIFAGAFSWSVVFASFAYAAAIALAGAMLIVAPYALLRKSKQFVAVENVSFKLRKGHTLGVVGESGSGKTTMGLTLLRLHEPTGGEVIFDGKNLLTLSDKERLTMRRRIQVVFQNPYASLNPRFTIGQTLVEPMTIHGIGASLAEREQRARTLLEKVGLDGRAFAKYPHEFSGGQRQRVAIARCLTLNPEVLVLDEAVSALDVSVQAQVLNLLKDLQDELGLSYVFISHDLAVVRFISDEVLVMKDGEVVEQASAAEILAAPKQEYTKRLLAAIPRGYRAAA